MKDHPDSLPELLAPAGSWDALVAAVAAGADAVYLGGRRFGARALASNFDDSELKEAVDYAHLRGVKVYVTVNTLVHDGELLPAAGYLLWLYEIGVDAVLVQDLGVVSLAREILPDLGLHASTQMTVHNREGAAWAARLGMKRVVLARELSLEELKDMALAGIGLEIFVHGALCYCYSGQCLLSTVMGGRSGNRGVCAQPCRKEYRLVRGKKDGYGRPLDTSPLPIEERYLLSTKDLSLYSHLDEVVDAPVESLKIEGRMRSPEYVAAVVGVYRKALNAITSGGWRPSEEDLQDLALAFNRGFTLGHLLGARGKDLMGQDRPDNRGLLLGEVTSLDGGVAAVRLKSELLPAKDDGLAFVSPSGSKGMVLRSQPMVSERCLFLPAPGPVKPGTEVWLTRRAELNRRTEKVIGDGLEVKWPLDVQLRWEDRTPVIDAVLKGPFGPLSLSVRGVPMEEAKKRPITESQMEAQLRRTGGTPFSVGKVEMSYPGGLFSPLSSLNRLRRDLLAAAEARLLGSFRPETADVSSARSRLDALREELSPGPREYELEDGGFWLQSLSVYVDDLATLRGALAGGGCDRVYLEPPVYLGPRGGRHTSGEGRAVLDLLKEAGDVCREAGAELVWKWPKISRRRYLDFAVDLLPQAFEDGLSEVMVDGMGAAEAVLAVEPGMALTGSSGLNVWNHRSVRLLSATFKRLTLSPELSARNIQNLVSIARKTKGCPHLELVAQGSQEVVVSEDCLPLTALGEVDYDFGGDSFLGLRDSTGRIFPLRVDGEGRTHLYNAVETCLVDRIPLLGSLDSLAIDARGRTESYAREMVEIYSEAIRPDGEADLNSLKKRAMRISIGGITTGAFLKD